MWLIYIEDNKFVLLYLFVIHEYYFKLIYENISYSANYIWLNYESDYYYLHCNL